LGTLMKHKNILITGGAGFVGSNLAVRLKERYPEANVLALDNLKRRGAELNLPRLEKTGVKFIHGDIRNKEDLNFSEIDLLIECSAEPSVMAGVDSPPEYLLQTNLVGAINCFELARKNKADVIFLSTSRIYPIAKLNSLRFIEEKTRFSLTKNQVIEGASEKGISEKFPLDGVRSLYGATKLAAELILQEYIENYGIKGVINRCGVITGPWQMGKVDQGVVVLWLSRHVFRKNLSYLGYDGKGKQVRDFIHIDDLFDLLEIQINNIDQFSGEIYNIGGGATKSFSLLELTGYCQKITGHKIKITPVKEERKGDVRIYITDTAKINQVTAWKPKISLEETLKEIYRWIVDNPSELRRILTP